MRNLIIFHVNSEKLWIMERYTKKYVLRASGGPHDDHENPLVTHENPELSDDVDSLINKGQRELSAKT